MATKPDPVRRYLTHDCDQERVELLLMPPDGNGDWYLSIVPAGHRLGFLTAGGGGDADHLHATVRVVTSGERHEHHGVANAVAALYRAMGGEGIAEPTDFATPLAALVDALPRCEVCVDQDSPSPAVALWSVEMEVDVGGPHTFKRGSHTGMKCDDHKEDATDGFVLKILSTTPLPWAAAVRQALEALGDSR